MNQRRNLIIEKFYQHTPANHENGKGLEAGDLGAYDEEGQEGGDDRFQCKVGDILCSKTP